MKENVDSLTNRLLSAVNDELPAAYDLRRQIHSAPEVGGKEAGTSALVAEALGASEALWITEGRLVRIPVGTGPAVAVRGELDALPAVETSGLPWAATNGAAHLCGHDVHLAALVALGNAVRREGGTSPLVAVLQPREEILPSGAKDILESPLFASEQVGAIIGAHVHASMPAGTVAVQEGPVNASADDFMIAVRGTTGHGAYPHHTRDSVAAAAAVVTALLQLPARRIDPMHPSVVTVGSIVGGASGNVVPEVVTLLGTIRSFDETDRRDLHQLVGDAARLTAQIHGCSAEVSIQDGDPIMINDSGLARLTAANLTDLGLNPNGDHRSCGGDDFARYNAAGYPALMAFVGVDSPDGIGLHHSAFVPSDEAIRDVAYTMLAGYLAGCEFLSR